MLGTEFGFADVPVKVVLKKKNLCNFLPEINLGLLGEDTLEVIGNLTTLQVLQVGTWQPVAKYSGVDIPSRG